MKSYLQTAMNPLKTLLVSALTFFVVSNLAGQTRLKLVLRSSQKVDSVQVTHWTNKQTVTRAFKDTVRVNLKTTGPDFYDINFISDGMIYNNQVFLDTGNVEIFASMAKGRVVIDSVAGSPYYQRIKKWQDTYTALRAKKGTDVIDSFFIAGYKEFADDLYSFRLGSMYLNIHKSNPSKLYPLLPFIAAQDSSIKKKFGFSIFHDKLQTLISNQPVALFKFQFLDPNNSVVNGDTATRGNVILNFWSADCASCLEDHKRIMQLLPALKKNRVQFVSIAADGSFEEWKQYLDANKYAWTHYKELSENRLVDELRINTFPIYMLVDLTGKILYTTSSPEEIVKQADRRN
jgi:hypothetical protein